VFGCAQAPQFSTADLGTRPVHSYLQFKHWRWGDMFVCELFRDRFKTTDHSFYAARYFSEN